MPEDKDTIQRTKTILLGFAVQGKRADGSTQISVRWGRIVAVLLALLITGWTSATGALFAYLKYKEGVETIRFKDAFLFSRDVLRRKTGDHQIAESIARIEEGNYSDAFRLLHFGVARSPGNLEGRKLIADFYEVGRKRPSIAADFMIAGLEHGGIEDIEYIKQLLQLLLRNQMDEKVLEIADMYLPKEPDFSEINRILALGAASALYQRGSYDQADHYLIGYNLIDLVDGLLISSKVSWDRGNRIAAITKLEQSLNRFPNAEPILMQLSNYYREMGEVDKARRFALLRNLKDPLNPKPRLELLYIYNQSGDTEREENEIERMFEQFGKDKNALLEFANFASQTGKVELALRIQKVALENDMEIDLFTILSLQAHLFAKDYKGALTFSEELIEERPDWLTERWALFNGLRAIAAYAEKRPDLGEVYLQHFIDEKIYAPQTYLNIANHFSTINRIPQAGKVLTIAYQQLPTNQKILTELIRVELKLGNTENLNDLLTRLLQMRRPQMELLVEAYRKLGSDHFLFAQNRENLLLQIGAILREHNQSLSLVETTR